MNKNVFVNYKLSKSEYSSIDNFIYNDLKSHISVENKCNFLSEDHVNVSASELLIGVTEISCGINNDVEIVSSSIQISCEVNNNVNNFNSPPDRSVYIHDSVVETSVLVSEQNNSEGHDPFISPTTVSTSASSIPENVTNSDADGNNGPFPELTDFRRRHAKQLVMAHLNINSVRNKFVEIHEMLTLNLCDILFLSETKLDQSFCDGQFNITDYRLYRNDRNEHGGGIMCYVRSDITHRRRSDIEYNENGIESMVIEHYVNKSKCFVICLYKPPSVNVSFLKSAIDNICNKCLLEGEFLNLIGDFNENFMIPSHGLSDTIDVYSLKNLIEGATCFKNNDNPTLLDVLLTNNARKFSGSFNINIGISDFHNIIGAATKAHVPRKKVRTVSYRSYKHFNENDYQASLQQTPFHICDIFDDVDDRVWVYNKLLTDTIEQHAPIKTRKIRGKSAPYMNDQLRRAINVKAMLKRKFNRLKTTEAWNRYKCQRNLVNKLKRQSIKYFFDKHCTKDETSTFWSTVKPYFSNRNQNGNNQIALFEDNVVVNSQTEISNIFNDYFINVANNLDEGIDVKTLSIDQINEHYENHQSIIDIKNHMHNCNDSLSLVDVTSDQVFKKLSNLKIKKSCGYDGIPARLVKSGANVLCHSLCSIINYSISLQTFPNLYKYAEITPLYKKKDQLSKCNYRPVSVLCTLSKVLESVICDQFNEYFNVMVSDKLAAYRKGYSCENVLFSCVEEWKQALDNNETAAIIAMDLSKAFDSIPHGLLIAKLSSYGVSTNTCNYVKSYLTDRMQRVKIDNVRSKWLTIKRGVPQGSLTGPLLFNIFLNDLLLNMGECSIYNYADDNTLSYHHSNVNHVKNVLEHAATAAIDWFSINFMEANASKFQSMIMSRSECNLDLKVNGISIPTTNYVQLLGIDIDNSLNFNTHVSKLCRKAAKRLNCMGRLSKILSQECLIKIFDAFIRSSFSYCTVIWHFCGKRLSKKVEKIQERALRLTYQDFRSDYMLLLENSGRHTLYDIRVKNIAVNVFKVLNNLLKPVKHDFYVYKGNSYSLRNVKSLERPNVNTITYGRHSLRYEGVVIWENLPNNVKLMESLIKFKEAVSKLELKECDCTTVNCVKCGCQVP